MTSECVRTDASDTEVMGHWRENEHFVVIIEMKNKYFYIFDSNYCHNIKNLFYFYV